MFEPGELIQVTAAGFVGLIGVVVKWNSELFGEEKPNMIPVFLPRYPETLFWYFQKEQLKAIDTLTNLDPNAKIRFSALAKLTLEERKVLGL